MAKRIEALIPALAHLISRPDNGETFGEIWDCYFSNLDERIGYMTQEEIEEWLRQEIEMAVFDEEEIIRNAEVHILKNSSTGDISYGWVHGGTCEECAKRGTRACPICEIEYNTTYDYTEDGGYCHKFFPED